MKFSGFFILTFLILIFIFYIRDAVKINKHKPKHGPKKSKKLNDDTVIETVPKDKIHSKKPQVQTDIRPWEKCKSPERYVFLKKHKVASRNFALQN